MLQNKKFKKLKISIITVCFNSCKTIEYSIKSVVSQSYSNIEYIVIDGLSKDGTADIIARYKDKISVVVSEPDGGIYNAMNKGLKYASGDVIFFLNSDDIISNKDTITNIMTHFNLGEYDVVMCDIIYVGSIVKLDSKRFYSAAFFERSRLKRGLMPPHPGFFVRRDFYSKLNGFDESFQIAGDFEFICRLFNDHSLKCKKLSIVSAYMSLGGVSNRYFRNLITINKEILRACKKNDINTNIFLLMSRYPRKIFDIISAHLYSFISNIT